MMLLLWLFVITCFLYKPAMLIVIRCCRGYSFIFLKSKNGCKNYSVSKKEKKAELLLFLCLFCGVILKMKWIFFVLQFHLFLYSIDTQKTTTVVSSFRLQSWFSQKYWFFFFFFHTGSNDDFQLISISLYLFIYG